MMLTREVLTVMTLNCFKKASSSVTQWHEDMLTNIQYHKLNKIVM